MKKAHIIIGVIAALLIAACTPTPVETPAVSDRMPGDASSAEDVPISLANQAQALQLQSTLVGLYELANPSVVFIVVPPVGSGSGFVFDSEGHIVTNNHVVEDGERFEVIFASGERSFADLVGSDVDSDLAVLKVDDLPDTAAPLPLADGDSIQVGQFVVAIGNPFGEQGSMSFGIISGLGRSLSSQRELESGSRYSLPEVIQTDAPINPGNSGGPLINLQGEVVGVNAAINTFTGANSGVGFSIPVQAVAQIVPNLIADGEYIYPYMGVAFDGEVSLDEADLYGLNTTQGAYVVDLVEDGPGEQAGLQPADPTTGQGGDLITALDGQPIRDFADLNSYLVFNTQPGQTLELTVLRGGEEITIDMTLGERP